MIYQLCEEALIATRNLAVWAGIMRVETANLIFTYEQIASAAFLSRFNLPETRGISLSSSDGLCIWDREDAARVDNPYFVYSKALLSWPDYHQKSTLDFQLSDHEKMLVVTLTISYSPEGKTLCKLIEGIRYKPSLSLPVFQDQVVPRLGIKQDIIALGESGDAFARKIAVYF